MLDLILDYKTRNLKDYKDLIDFCTGTDGFKAICTDNTDYFANLILKFAGYNKIIPGYTPTSIFEMLLRVAKFLRTYDYFVTDKDNKTKLWMGFENGISQKPGDDLITFIIPNETFKNDLLNVKDVYRKIEYNDIVNTVKLLKINGYMLEDKYPKVRLVDNNGNIIIDAGKKYKQNSDFKDSSVYTDSNNILSKIKNKLSKRNKTNVNMGYEDLSGVNSLTSEYSEDISDNPYISKIISQTGRGKKTVKGTRKCKTKKTVKGTRKCKTKKTVKGKH